MDNLMLAITNTELLKRFDAKTDKRPELCWVWTGSYYKDGYPRFSIKGKWFRANRVCWQLVYGPIPEGMCVCHHCDNPKCVRPSHLFLGTQQDNLKDMHKKGRGRGPTEVQPNRGEGNGSVKLSAKQVSQIRELRGSLTQAALAHKFSISQSQICRTQNNQKWSYQ